MSVPSVDLKRDVASHRDEYLAITARVIDSGVFSLGPEVEAFERAFASYLGVKHAVGVNGGTLALLASFLALGIGPGDEVIMPANTFIATAEPIALIGATPVFCDVDSQTHLLDLASCERLVTPKTKAIVPVHLYGRVAPMDDVIAFAKKQGLKVIEDAAQAHGSVLNGRKAGSFGDAACFSFYPTKNLGALGEGGAVVTNDDTLAERLRAIRLHGIMKEKYRHDILGLNLKMEALQGAFLSSRLTRLDGKNVRRREIAARYRAGLANVVECPADAGEAHVYHLFVIMTDRRNELMAHLKANGIGTGIHYPIPVHLQPSFARYGGKEGQCLAAEASAKRMMSLPMFPEMTDAEVDEVIAAVRTFAG
ncbi:MAG TPA: DegT/DnrJ/EryC1/StrS family aminotransferase [Candidatus Methylomirabilis sp.]|nr:DegT/DnrJ/EryC1/StrS family aminotransferase [Candidatus Methylomirabilis sp.]